MNIMATRDNFESNKIPPAIPNPRASAKFV
jgi:hypothetical protein